MVRRLREEMGKGEDNIMRDIKFRAWDGECMLRQEELDAYSIHELRKGVLCDRPCEGDQTRITLMQYTGLKDKYGKEIYESDILRDFEPDYFVAEYSDASFWCVGYKDGKRIVDMFEPFILGKSEIESQQLEVIGNIYENPELMK